jgi:Mn-dependent DtxR family transcriptional regulator
MADATEQPGLLNEHDVTAIELPADYWKALVEYTEYEQGEPAIGEFARLQRMITHLLNEVVRVKADIEHNQTTSLKQMNLLRQILHQYGEHHSVQHFVKTC